MRVLLVEDESSIAAPVKRAFEREGYEVEATESGREALRLAASWDPDVILLDLMLPDLDGRAVARGIRVASDVPILMVTARGEESERVAGFEMGADDYIVKPFSLPELLARVRAVARRRVARTEAELTFKDLRLDPATHRAFLGGRELHLSKKEFELARMVLAKRGGLARRDELIAAIWNVSPEESGKTLDVHMSWLRKKLDDDAKAPRYIETVRGVGFRLVAG